MQTGKKLGMMLMDENIISLYHRGLIDPKHALEKVLDRERFLSIIGGKGDSG